MHKNFLYAAYGLLAFGGVMHFAIDVVSQYARGKRVAGPEATLYYGLNTAYAFSQLTFALLALLTIRQGVAVVGQWPGLTLGFLASAGWMTICFFFLEYRDPRIALAIFAALLVGAALTAG